MIPKLQLLLVSWDAGKNLLAHVATGTSEDGNSVTVEVSLPYSPKHTVADLERLAIDGARQLLTPVASGAGGD